ncbi:MAG: N-6 DNA methylase [Verrucomicrobia bacterium]|nr:N-6 DNA methylase [Verrucomicrobiota bacterium]
MPEQIPRTFEEAFKRVQHLAADFKANERRYLASDYQEAEVRKDFIDKFWFALGWDVNHDFQTNPYEQEVKVERGVNMAAGSRRADYAFYLKPNFREADVRFYVEAKKPSVELASKEVYFQVIRYGWSSNTPLAVVHDFEQFHVLDCRYKPDVDTALNRAVATYHFSDYANPEKFKQIYWLFSREAVAGGSLEKRAAELPKPRGIGAKRGMFPSAAKPVDEDFLETLDEHRTDLARAFKSKNPRLDSESLTELAQRTLDRLVFLRFLEDKGIEAQRLVERFGAKGKAWEDFVAASRRLDGIYNGIVFKEHAILDKPGFRVDEDIFGGICERLTAATTPYDFNFIPIHILGSIYERFLGKVIVATDKRVRVEEKPEVRKAGGVYYTPEYIVRYIVENTVGKLIASKKPEQIAEMHFADIACGSGSFLLGVFDLLLQHHGSYYNSLSDTERARAIKRGDCVERDGDLYLSLRKKREILVNNIYGVDIDAQAVEVCQLSLYLKLLKDETTVSAHQYLMDFEHVTQMKRLLPDLSKNIVCGNSLIGRDISEGQLFANDEERKLNPMNFGDAFPHIFAAKDTQGMVREAEPAYEVGRTFMREGGRRVHPGEPIQTRGFDAIVGNPPYRMLQPHNTSNEVLAYLRNHFVAAEFKIDLFHLFLQRAVALLKDGGYLSYIIPTTILNNVYAETLRGWLMDRCVIQQIAVARGRVFADADVHTSVLVLRSEYRRETRQANQVQTTAELDEAFAANPAFNTRTRQSTFSELPGRVWNILVNEVNASLISRLTKDFAPLEKVAIINRGLITGDREKYFAKTKKTAQHVPIVAGSDVHRYHTERPSEFVLFKRPNTAGGCWDKEVHFAPHKLVVRQICEEPTASILRTPLAVTGNIFTARADSVETELYLLGIINSRLTGFFWRTMFADFKTSFPQVTIFSLAQVPIRVLDLSKSAERSCRDEMVKFVETMLEAKATVAKAQTDKDRNYYEAKCAALDRQIDALVYQLYGLTAEEIAIVEGAGKS